jgi:iron complex outermembrane receptor protein
MKIIKSRAVIQAALSIAAGVSTQSPTVYAQSGPTLASDALDEVIVTAQRKEQSLQDVPITVNVLDARTLDRYSVIDIRDAVSRVPGLEIRTSNEQDSVTLRGLGNFGSTNYGFDSPIGIFIDGVYHGRINQTKMAFMDMERMEVLKGPQSTLFGMNTPIGAISFTSKRPSSTFSGDILVTGDFKYDHYDVRGAINMPVSDTLAIRVAGLKTFEKGYYFNTTTSRHEGGSDASGWRISAQWTPSDRLTVLAKVQGGTVERTGPQLLAVSPPTRASDLAAARAVDPRANFDPKDLFISQLPGFQKNRHTEPVLTVNYQFEPFTLESITAYSDYEGTFSNPLTGSPVNLGRVLGDEDFSQFSQELRITSNGTGMVDYQAGLFYQSSKLYNQRPLDFILGNFVSVFAGTPSGGLQTYIGNFRQTYDTHAAFAQGTLNVGNAWKLSGGLRVTRDKKSASSVFDWVAPGTRTEADILRPGTPAFAAADFVFNAVFGINRHRATGEYSKTFLIPDVKVQWQPSDRTMAYASVGQGRQAGGFSDRDNKGFNFAFGPEKATNYEIGTKLTFLDRRLQINAAVFRTDFNDLQVSIFDLVTNDFIVGNAANAISQGVDADFRYRIGPSFSIDGGFTWLNKNRYQEFIAPCSATAANVATCIAPVRPGPGVQDRSNEELGNAKFTAVAGAEFDAPIGNQLGLNVRFDLRHMSSKPISANNPAMEIPAMTFLDGKVGLTYKETYTLSLVAQNITDRREIEQAGTFLVPGLIIGTTSPPRVIALQLGAKF